MMSHKKLCLIMYTPIRYMLKRSAALSNGLHLVLFNPDSETEAEFARDEANWRAYRHVVYSMYDDVT